MNQSTKKKKKEISKMNQFDSFLHTSFMNQKKQQSTLAYFDQVMMMGSGF